MNRELWQRIKPVFHAALECDPASRAQFVVKACGTDQELRDEVERLLAAEAAATGPLGVPIAGLTAAVELPADADPRFQPGSLLLSRFRVVRSIGGGGMGEVYEAEDLQLGRIALKTIRPEIVSSPEIFGRFRQEVLVARKVAGPQVCRVHELFLLPAAGGLGATAFLTMEFIDGLTLSRKLRQDGPLPWKEALPIALELCTGLCLIHEKGIIHRDLKSSNIMLSNENGKVRTVLMDFGLARDFSAAVEQERLSTDTTAISLSRLETMAGDMLGTPDYMAPEQFEGRPVSPATDIYALGIVLYELVTGVHPYTADSPVAAAIHRARQPKPASSIQRALPRQWDRVIRRCLEYEPEARFQSAAEVSKALRTGPANLANLRQDRPWLAGALAVLILAMFAWAGALWWQQRLIYRPDVQVLKPYSDGIHALKESNYIGAAQEFETVVKKEPTFAMAHVRLAEAWADLDFEGSAQRELLIAMPNERRLSVIDRERCDAVQAMVMGDYSRAQAIYRSMLPRLDAADLDAGYMDLGWAYERSGDTTRALESYRKAAALNPNNAAAAMRIGVLESRLQHLPEAESAFAQAQAIFKTEVSEEGRADLDFERGYAANHMEKDDAAKQYLLRALEEAKEIPSVQLEIRTLTQLSSLASSSAADSEHSVEYAEEAIRLAQDNRLDTWAADALVRLANAQLSLGHLDQAQVAIDESLQLVHQSPQPRVEALANMSLASLMDQKHKPDQVIGPAQAAFAYYTRVGNPIDAFKAQQLLTRVQRNKGDLKQALESGMQLLAVSAKTGSQGSVIQSEELVGSILMYQEDFAGALPHFERAAQLAGSGGYRPYELNHCGEALWKLGRYDESDARLQSVAGNENVVMRASEIRVKSLLSRRKFAAALVLARQIIAEHPKMDSDRRLNLTLDVILAEAELSMKTKAEVEFATYRSSRQQETDLESAATLQLVLAQIELALGEPGQARDDAGNALAYFMSRSKPDSTLRAAGLAAEASKALHDTDGFRKNSAKVIDLLTDVQHTWTPQTFQTYRARPDLVVLTRDSVFKGH